MLHYIKGTVEEALPGMLVIECGGLGYEVNVADGCRAALAAGSGEEVTLYTAMIVKEDDVSLYGFSDKGDLAFFRLLLGVNGVGPKAAMSILSVLPAGQLKRAIVFEDADAVSRANGVGKKTAQRVIMELKDKVEKMGGLEDIRSTSPTESKASENAEKDQAVLGLVALGFSRTEALTALAGASEGLSAQEYIRIALRNR